MLTLSREHWWVRWAYGRERHFVDRVGLCPLFWRGVMRTLAYAYLFIGLPGLVLIVVYRHSGLVAWLIITIALIVVWVMGTLHLLDEELRQAGRAVARLLGPVFRFLVVQPVCWMIAHMPEWKARPLRPARFQLCWALLRAAKERVCPYVELT